jgi:hypothetical protein
MLTGLGRVGIGVVMLLAVGSVIWGVVDQATESTNETVGLLTGLVWCGVFAVSALLWIAWRLEAALRRHEFR